MRNDKEKNETELLGGKPLPVLLCPPHIPHGQAWGTAKVSLIKGREITA